MQELIDKTVMTIDIGEPRFPSSDQSFPEGIGHFPPTVLFIQDRGIHDSWWIW